MGDAAVRHATGTDWRAIAVLLEELGRPGVLGEPDEHEHQHRYLAYLDRNDAVALVAEVSGCVVGFVNMEFRMRLHFRSEQAWIPDLVVAPGYRGAGIGAALLAEAERLAWERGCWGMALDSAHWRIDAHRFYTTQGWADTGGR